MSYIYRGERAQTQAKKGSKTKYRAEKKCSCPQLFSK